LTQAAESLRATKYVSVGVAIFWLCDVCMAKTRSKPRPTWHKKKDFLEGEGAVVKSLGSKKEVPGSNLGATKSVGQ